MDPPKFAYIWIYRRIAAYNGWDVLLMLLSWMLMVFGFTPFIESSTSWATPWYQHNVHLLTQINLKLIHFDWRATGQPIHAPPVKTKSFKRIERKMESEGVDVQSVPWRWSRRKWSAMRVHQSPSVRGCDLALRFNANHRPRCQQQLFKSFILSKKCFI